MHEIKFRGQRKDNGEWVKGYLYEEEFSSWILREKGIQLTPNTVNGPAEYDTEVEWIEVIPEAVGQFTGLKGRDEVYRGDIIEYQHKVALSTWRATVVWDENKLRWGLGDGIALTILYGYRWQIIGDIHSNPELREEIKQ